MDYLVIIEKSDHNYSAFMPDVPGCVATGATTDEVLKNLKIALALHLQGLKEDGLPIPEPAAQHGYVSTSV